MSVTVTTFDTSGISVLAVERALVIFHYYRFEPTLWRSHVSRNIAEHIVLC